MVWLEPGRGVSHPSSLGKTDFQQAIQRLAHSIPLQTSPQEAARALLQAGGEEEWLAEVDRGRVLTLVPMSPHSTLAPEADATLRQKYLGWCEARGGGDCLDLLEDGPYLRMEDRRTLALAMALGSVLEETHAALAREFNPRALVAMAVWTVGMYCMAWLVPEPTLKAVAATMTVILVAWLGIETVWGLMEGWVRLVTQAQEATTFEELGAAAARYAQVMGTDAARALILAVGAVTGRVLGSVATRVRSLPGFGQAQAQWQAQGGSAVLEQRASVQQALAAAVGTVETVVISAQAPMAVVFLKGGTGAGGLGSAPGGRAVRSVLRHRGGNQQVVLSDGQRWHLPRGKSLSDIPAQDRVGDQLQAAVTKAANEWGPEHLSLPEKAAIKRALRQGRYWLARLLEREAKGRFVQSRVKKLFEPFYDFSLNGGVDVIDPKTGLQYEILSGTESNMALHGRRMAGIAFRMLTF